MTLTGLIITKDVFFASKVTGTAGALGAVVRSVSSLDSLRNAVAADGIRLVILDLDCPDITPQAVIAALPPGAEMTTIAFGPHIHEQRLAAARAVGFQQVLPRSKFSATLGELLREFLLRESPPAVTRPSETGPADQ